MAGSRVRDAGRDERRRYPGESVTVSALSARTSRWRRSAITDTGHNLDAAQTHRSAHGQNGEASTKSAPPSPGRG